MIYAVIGLGFGDEGKGLTTDYLCSKSNNSLVVRFSGGHQAGHTVKIKQLQHVFSNFGSGTLRNCPTYWSEFCTVEPIGLWKEFETLQSKGFTPKIFIDERCPITTPFDVIANRCKPEMAIHGSCGLGFGETWERESKNYSLLFRDLYYPSVAKIKIELIKNYYQLHKPPVFDLFLESIKNITANGQIVPIYGMPENAYDNIVFEGSQGLLLDKKIGFFPHVTRSNTGTKNILAFTKEEIYPYLVTRAYQTRHGNGVMTNEKHPHNIKENPHETNIYNEFQGVFRKSLLDLDLLKYAIHSDLYLKNCKNNTLVITNLDQMEQEYRFTHKEKIVYCDNENDFITKISNILNIEKVLISKSPEAENIYKFQ